MLAKNLAVAHVPEHLPSCQSPTCTSQYGGRHRVQGTTGQLGLVTPSQNFSQNQPNMRTTDNRSRLTDQLPVNFSWRPDPLALATDAFLQDWSGKICYANPPWGLLLKVLSEVSHQQADVIIVAPVWKGQSWFPVLLSLPFDFPHLVLLSTCPILSQHSMPPCSSFRMYNWPHGPPQGILPNKKVFRTSFRTSHCILTTRVHQILQFTLSQVKVLVFSMEWKSYFRSCSGNLKFLAKLYQEGYSYGSLNLYRFIISSVHEHIEGFPIG